MQNLGFNIIVILILSSLIGDIKISSTHKCDLESQKTKFQKELNNLKHLKDQEQISESEYAKRSIQLFQDQFDSLLQKATSSPSVPAIAVGITTNEKILFIGVSGIKKVGEGHPVKKNDLFHTGSNTKAMTATLAGILVNKGLINWDTKPAEVFGIECIKDDTLTLAHLLTHTGGIPPYTDGKAYRKVPKFNEDLTTQRYEFAKWLLPQRDVTGEFAYSNAGYSITAAMMERVTGLSWESLIEKYLFAPLNLKAVIGWPANDISEQTWGHSDQWILVRKISHDGKVWPHSPQHRWKIHPLNQPAGDVSLSIVDYMKFLQEHLRGLNGQSQLIPKEIFDFLHSPMKGTNSACGWGINKNEYTGLQVHGHSGYAFTFYMLAGLFPEKNFAVAISTNSGSGEAIEICKNLANVIIQVFWDWYSSYEGHHCIEIMSKSE